MIEQAVGEFTRLPGIGPKTAMRLVYHLLQTGPDAARSLGVAVGGLADRVHECSVCGNFSTSDPCEICTDAMRDYRTICVVESALDVVAFERTGRYKGWYHVLGGHLAPLDGIGPDDLNLSTLTERVTHDYVREVILATNSRIEGEATAGYIESLLCDSGVKITRLATGIPVSSDLVYVNDATLAYALEARREVVHETEEATDE